MHWPALGLFATNLATAMRVVQKVPWAPQPPRNKSNHSKEVRKEANTKDGGTVGMRFFAIQPYCLATQAAV